MLLPEPAKPAFWKAWLVTFIMLVPVGLVVGGYYHIAAPWGIGVTIVASILIAPIIHERMLNDWRAADTMHLEQFDRRTSVGRNIRIKR